MGFEIIDSQAGSFYSITVLGRRNNPEIKVSVFSRSLSVFWQATLPQSSLEEVWKQTRLSLVSAKCKPVRGTPEPRAKAFKTVQDIQKFVVENTRRQLGASITMKVKVENETIKPVTLCLAVDIRDFSTGDIGFDLNRTSWEQPQIRQLILNMFRRSFADGEVTLCEMDDLTAKITQLARPKKTGRQPQPAVANGTSD